MARQPTENDIRRIYRDTIDELYRFVSRRCNGDRDLAEDITQETWLRAVRAWHADGVPERAPAWLATVAARLLSNHFRRPIAELFDDGIHGAVSSGDARDAEQARDRRGLVRRALARLPAAQAMLLEAFHYDRRPVAEIAADVGASERAIEGRLRRAREKLRHEIESDPDADEAGRRGGQPR